MVPKREEDSLCSLYATQNCLPFHSHICNCNILYYRSTICNPQVLLRGEKRASRITSCWSSYKLISGNIIFASKGYDLRHFIIYTLFFNFRFNFFWYIPISTIFQKTKIILSTILGVLSLSNYQQFSVFLGLLRVVSLLGLLLTDHPWEPKRPNDSKDWNDPNESKDL